MKSKQHIMSLIFVSIFGVLFSFTPITIAYAGGGDLEFTNSRPMTEVQTKTGTIIESGKQHLSEKTVILKGECSYEVHEIFDSLLQHVQHIEQVKRIRSQFISNWPERCVSVWSVLTPEDDTFSIQTGMVELLKDLTTDLEENQKLAQSHITFTNDDIELAILLRPYFSTPDRVTFSPKQITIGKRRSVRIITSPDMRGYLNQGFD